MRRVVLAQTGLSALSFVWPAHGPAPALAGNSLPVGAYLLEPIDPVQCREYVAHNVSLPDVNRVVVDLQRALEEFSGGK